MILGEVKQKLKADYEECLERNDLEMAAGIQIALGYLQQVFDTSMRCKACGEWFMPKDPYNQKYCSAQCKKKHKRLRDENKKAIERNLCSNCRN